MANTSTVVSTNQKLVNNMNEEFKLINPNYSPFMSYLFRKGVKKSGSTTHEWFSDYVRPTQAKVATELSAVATTLIVGDADFGVVGTILKVGKELLEVTAVSGTSLTVTRGFNSTTPAIQAVGKLVRNQGFKLAEDADAVASKTKLIESNTNKTQIFEETYGLSRTAQSVVAHGVGLQNQLAVEETKAQIALLGQIENSFVSGNVYSVGTTRMCDGLETIVEANGLIKDASGADLTFTMVQELAGRISEAGGRADLMSGNYYLLCPLNQKSKINVLNQNLVGTGGTEITTVVRQDKDPVLGTDIMVLNTSAGRINVMEVSTISPDKVLLVNMSQLSAVALRDITVTELGVKGLADKYMIEGEMTLEVGKPKLTGVIFGLKEA